MAFYCHAAALWAYAMKRAVPCDATYAYINVKRRDRRLGYAALLADAAAGRGPLFCCLNDVAWKEHGGGWQEDLRDFLARRWPEPSPCERGYARQ
jgi:hypothetical protein